MARKSALVTGGKRGIGRGIVLALAEAGYDVSVNYFEDADLAEGTAQEARKFGGRAETIEADIRNVDHIGRMMDAHERLFGKIDLMVNNAGITRMAPFLETKPEMFDDVIDTDLKGLYFASQAAARLMVKHHTRGVIVNISSNHATGCWPRATAYAAAKAGVVKLTMNMALELSEYDIRVAGIAPGYTELEYFSRERAANYVEPISRKLPLGRFMQPDEVGAAVCYLASDKAGYITGTTLYMDGGALLPVAADNRFTH